MPMRGMSALQRDNYITEVIQSGKDFTAADGTRTQDGWTERVCRALVDFHAKPWGARKTIPQIMSKDQELTKNPIRPRGPREIPRTWGRDLSARFVGVANKIHFYAVEIQGSDDSSEPFSPRYDGGDDDSSGDYDDGGLDDKEDEEGDDDWKASSRRRFR